MDFVKNINEAQQSLIEDPVVPMDGLTNFYAASRNPVKGPKKPLAQSLNCEGKSRVYVLWRPWSACSRCLRDLEHGVVALPDDGDYICPHVQNREYEELLDYCLKGDYLIQTQEYITLQDGTRCVHMVWLQLDKNAEKASKKKETAKIFTPMHSDLIEERAKEMEDIIAAAAPAELEEYEEEPMDSENKKEAPEASIDESNG